MYLCELDYQLSSNLAKSVCITNFNVWFSSGSMPRAIAWPHCTCEHLWKLPLHFMFGVYKLCTGNLKNLSCNIVGWTEWCVCVCVCSYVGCTSGCEFCMAQLKLMTTFPGQTGAARAYLYLWVDVPVAACSRCVLR